MLWRHSLKDLKVLQGTGMVLALKMATFMVLETRTVIVLKQMASVLRERVAAVMVLKSMRHLSHSGTRRTTPVILGNILKFCTIRELSAFTKFGASYKSVVQHVIRNMIRQNLNNNENRLLAQEPTLFPDELGIHTNILN